MDVWCYFKRLFENHILVTMGAIWGTISAFIFPEEIYFTSAGVVLIVMALDLITKLYALTKQHKGLRNALKKREISSHKFAKGTMDKLIVLGIMLVICGCAYKLSPINFLATGLMQAVFTLMFLRDVLSILENLTDAGVSGLSMFKKIVKKKMDDCIKENTDPDIPDSNEDTTTI